MSGRGGASKAPDAATARRLLNWFRSARRPLPWRADRDPYHVWVAEVLLQQTRVAQAIPYFERFRTRFPTVRSLARAREDQILKVWEGAGYYARARNLAKAARELDRYRGGVLPQSVADLERLPGVGPYIARAVASLSFGVPVVAMEANGRRVAARWWAERGDVRTPAISRALERRLSAVLPRKSPGEFNEALMELGETICLPISPRCGECPVSGSCRAYATLRRPGSIPTRLPRRPRPHFHAGVLVVQAGTRFLIQQRGPSGPLAGLYEFPGGKIERGESPEAAARRELEEEAGVRWTGRLERLGVVHQAYSHFRVDLHVYRARLRRMRPIRRDHRRHWASLAEIRRLPLPKATEKIIDLLQPSGGSSRRQRPALDRR